LGTNPRIHSLNSNRQKGPEEFLEAPLADSRVIVNGFREHYTRLSYRKKHFQRFLPGSTTIVP